MHPTFFILPLIALIPICFYFYKYIAAMAEFFGMSRKHRKAKVLIITLLAIIIAFANSFFSIGFFTIVHIIVFALIMALINLIYRKAAKVPKGKGRTKEDANLWEKIYGCRLVPIILAAVFMIYGYFNMTNVIEKDFTITTDKELSQDYTVAMIADLHMGVSMDVETLEEYCQEISAKNLDFLVITGDMVDEDTTKEEMIGACKAIGNIETRYGIYYVWGNHDATQFIWPPDYTIEELQAELKANGIVELQDETALINNEINIVGRKDAAYLLADRKTVTEMMDSLNKDNYTIVLDHQPITLEETSQSGADLQLSGHTHAGQLLPLGYLMEMFGYCDLKEGYADWNGMDVIVSSGFAGFGSPIRTESHSAYEIITITGE